ncbi:MAG: two-component regulator propeller domain-containing protein [Verrucomicrobiota bacterium]|nr:two-component regulator propeller domain-containing protein [Verrucomicrobiota bacterium]
MLCRMVQRMMTICAALAAATPVQTLAAEKGLETEMPSYHVTRYTAEQGLPRNTVRALLQTSDGYIWVGTLAGRDGLWQSDADGWERIETVGTSAPEYPVLICPSRDGDLWIPWGGMGPPRLAVLRSGRSEFVDLSKLPDYPMNVFLEDFEGHLWIGTESGLCQLRRKAVRVYAREQGLRNDFVKSLTGGPDGTIWVGTEAGVSGIKDDVMTNLPPMETSGWGRAEGLLADRRERVWHCDQTHTVVAFEAGCGFRQHH